MEGLRMGRSQEAAIKFRVCLSSVFRIWKKVVAQQVTGEVVNVVSKRSHKISKKKWEIDYAQIEAIDVHKRGTIQSISYALRIPKSTVGRWSANHLFRPHTNAIKPLLAAPNKLGRLCFSLQQMHYNHVLNILKFKPMENTVHIDEKWFYLSRKTCRFYLTPTEADLLRVTKSKNFIPNVVFMAAVSRPIFDEAWTCIFDGKICRWPFVEEVIAKRDSMYRKKGTKELKPIQSITREVIKQSIINQIIPAIQEKWPPFLSRSIKIQQDNARTHIKANDADFQRVASSNGFDISLVQQPPNSPDCNTLDLGFFTAIQSLQQRIRCKNASELIEAVKKSFQDTDPLNLNKVFLSLQSVLREILKVQGGNNYKFPHMNKNDLLRQGNLPENLEVSQFLVRDNIDFLLGEEQSEGISELMTQLGVRAPYLGSGIPDLNLG